MSVTISPIRDASGTPTGASTVARDMTETNRAEVDRRALVETLLRRTIAENVTLRTVFARDLPKVKADGGRIEQVIMNMAVNVRYGVVARGTLAIETRTFETDDEFDPTCDHPAFSGRSAGGALERGVRDNGCRCLATVTL